jgi:hypothetical protein
MRETFTLDFNLNTFVLISDKTHEETTIDLQTIDLQQALTIMDTSAVTRVTNAVKAELDAIVTMKEISNIL